MHIRSVLFVIPLAASAALTLSACSGDDNFGTPPKGDAGATTDATTTATDAGGGADATPGADAAPGADASAPSPLKHIFYVMMENHGVDEIFGNTADAPFTNQIAAANGVATNYYGVTHPSLPNYLAAISGDFQGIWDDCMAGAAITCAPEEFVPGSGDGTADAGLTAAQVTTATAQPHLFTGDTIVDQLEAKSISWKAYMQGIPGAGATDEYAPVDTVDAGDGGSTLVPRKLYAQKHDPFMYFAKVRNDAARMQKIVPYTQLDADLASAAATPGFVWISPDQCHDMHGVSADNAAAVGLPACATPASGLDHSVIALGDAFLQSVVTKIIASPAWSESSAIVVVWDEDDYAGYTGCCGSPTGASGAVLGGSKVPAIVITSKNPSHRTVTEPMNHYSLLATIESLWGMPCLGQACTVTAKMTSLFTH